jgi:hypothetical protein
MEGSLRTISAGYTSSEPAAGLGSSAKQAQAAIAPWASRWSGQNGISVDRDGDFDHYVLSMAGKSLP